MGGSLSCWPGRAPPAASVGPATSTHVRPQRRGLNNSVAPYDFSAFLSFPIDSHAQQTTRQSIIRHQPTPSLPASTAFTSTKTVSGSFFCSPFHPSTAYSSTHRLATYHPRHRGPQVGRRHWRRIDRRRRSVFRQLVRLCSAHSFARRSVADLVFFLLPNSPQKITSWNNFRQNFEKACSSDLAGFGAMKSVHNNGYGSFGIGLWRVGMMGANTFFVDFHLFQRTAASGFRVDRCCMSALPPAGGHPMSTLWTR